MGLGFLGVSPANIFPFFLLLQPVEEEEEDEEGSLLCWLQSPAQARVPPLLPHFTHPSQDLRGDARRQEVSSVPSPNKQSSG